MKLPVGGNQQLPYPSFLHRFCRLFPVCVCLTECQLFLSVVFPCISSALPVSHTEGSVPRGYPASASSVTSRKLDINHRVVPVLVTQTHKFVWKSIGGSCQTDSNTQWSRMHLTKNRFSSFRTELVPCTVCVCGWDCVWGSTRVLSYCSAAVGSSWSMLRI